MTVAFTVVPNGVPPVVPGLKPSSEPEADPDEIVGRNVAINMPGLVAVALLQAEVEAGSPPGAYVPVMVGMDTVKSPGIGVNP